MAQKRKAAKADPEPAAEETPAIVQDWDHDRPQIGPEEAGQIVAPPEPPPDDDE